MNKLVDRVFNRFALCTYLSSQIHLFNRLRLFPRPRARATSSVLGPATFRVCTSQGARTWGNLGGRSGVKYLCYVYKNMQSKNQAISHHALLCAMGCRNTGGRGSFTQDPSNQ